jgi:hypothetical protein
MSDVAPTVAGFSGSRTRDKEFPDWSDRRIAEVCGVGDHLVSSVRSENQVRESRTSTSEASDSDTSSPSKPSTRTGRDGKQYPKKPAIESEI